MSLLPLFAVHLSDGVLYWPWWVAGIVAAVAMVVYGALQIRDDELPRIALLTAAFFVASLIHVKIGPTSVHLLLNGLVGVMLGRRACLAIPIGLLLQVCLLGHGGFTTLGVNTVVIGMPALFAGWYFQINRGSSQLGVKEATLALSYLLHPLLLLLLGPAVFAWHRLERRWDIDGVFRAGFVAGGGAVFFTAALNSLLLVVAGEEDWRLVAAGVLAVHLPLVVIEGLIVGFAASFLMKVQPALLRVPSSKLKNV